MLTTDSTQAHDDHAEPMNDAISFERERRRVPLDPVAREQVKRDSDRRQLDRALGMPTWIEAEEMRALRAFRKERDAARRHRAVPSGVERVFLYRGGSPAPIAICTRRKEGGA